MLIVSRKNGQKIIINDNIEVIVVETKNGLCKIAINAPKDVKIYREEVYLQIQLANLMSDKSSVEALESITPIVPQSEVKKVIVKKKDESSKL